MDDKRYEAARKRVKKKKDFYKNLMTWAGICGGLLVFNAFNYRGHWWAIYPLLGWGLGILFQAFDVFGFPGYSNDWEERELEKEITRMKMRERDGYAPLPPHEEDFELEDWRQKSRVKEKKWRDDDLV